MMSRERMAPTFDERSPQAMRAAKYGAPVGLWVKFIAVVDRDAGAAEVDERDERAG